jgi:MFS family permease
MGLATRRATPTSAGTRIAVSGLAALAVAIGVGRFAFTPLLPMMQADHDLSVAAGGWLASANYAGYLLGALSVMVLPVRPAVAIRGGLVAIGLLTAGMGLADRFEGWLVLRTLAGIASAWVLVHVSAWALERLAPLRLPSLSGVVFAGVGTGIAAVGGLCLILMRAAASAAHSWIAMGILSLILAAVIWKTLAAGNPPHLRTEAKHSQRPKGWYRESVGLVFSYAAFGFGYIIPATFLPVMARDAIPDPAVFGWSWPAFGAAAALSTIAAGWITPHMGNRSLLIASLLLMALGDAVPLLLPGMTGVVLSALLVGGTFMVATMTGLKEAREHGGENPTRLMAAMTAGFAFGQIIGPLTVSYANAYSVPLLVGCASLSLAACVLMRRHGSNDGR